MWLVYLLLGIVAAALVVVVLAVYLAYFAATLVLAAVTAGAVSAVALLWAYLVTFTKVLVLRPASLTPPGRWPQSSKDADPAVLQYFYGPAFADAWHIAAIAADRGRRQAKKGVEAIKWAFSADSIPWLTAPVGVGAVVGAFTASPPRFSVSSPGRWFTRRSWRSAGYWLRRSPRSCGSRTPQGCGLGVFAWCARGAASMCPIRHTRAPGETVRVVTRTSGQESSASSGATACAGTA